MKRTVVLILAVLMVALPAAATQAATYTPPPGATFNTPKPWGNDEQRFRIVRKVESALNSVQKTADDPSPTILIATYFLDRKPTVDALINACKRGVSVRVVLDGAIDNAQAKRLITTLNADNVADADQDGVPDGPPTAGACGAALPGARSAAPTTTDDPTTAEVRRSASVPTEDAFTWGSDKSYVKSCVGSCRGGDGNMHSKFFVMSNSGSARFVEMISSSNLNEGGALKGWNDMFTVVNRPVLFNTFKRVHREMTDDVAAGRARDETVDGPYTVRFFPMAKAGKANDPTLLDLNKIRCTSNFGRTKVRISMFYWDGTRGNWLADKVIALGRAGCDVRVIYGAPSKDIRLKLRAAAVKKTIMVYDSRVEPLPDGTFAYRTHGKYVAVRGTYAGNRSASVVMTGSANWVGGSLAVGDETSINIASASAYNSYAAAWSKVQRHSVKIPARR